MATLLLPCYDSSLASAACTASFAAKLAGMPARSNANAMHRRQSRYRAGSAPPSSAAARALPAPRAAPTTRLSCPRRRPTRPRSWHRAGCWREPLVTRPALIRRVAVCAQRGGRGCPQDRTSRDERRQRPARRRKGGGSCTILQPYKQVTAFKLALNSLKIHCHRWCPPRLVRRYFIIWLGVAFSF
jgi:hypothetical protein